jgi:hypothetical protein
MHTIYNKSILLCWLFLLAITAVANTPSEADFNKLTKTFILNPDGSQEFRCSKELTLHSHPAMNSTYGETFIVYNPEFQKLVIHSSYTRMVDGTIVKTPDNAFNEVLPRFAAGAPAYNELKEMVVTHTGLELGATIYLDYSVISKTGFYKKLDIDETLQESSPVKEYSVTISVPEQTAMSYSLTGASGIKVVKNERKESGQKLVSWTLKQVPASFHEPYMPENNPAVPLLSASTYSSRKDALSSLNEGITKIRSLETETYATYITDSLADNFQKISVILNHVLSGITYTPVPLEVTGYTVREADEVLRSAYGTMAEKANLLVTMLRAINVPAEIIAVYPGTLESSVCGLNAIKELLVKTTLNGTNCYLPVISNSASLLPFRGNLDVVCTLTGEQVEILPQQVKTSASYDINLSASEAKVKGIIVTTLNAFPMDYETAVKQWVGTNDAVIKRGENETITITFTVNKPVKIVNGYIIYKLPELPYAAVQLNSKRSTIFEVPHLSDETSSYKISLAPDLKLETPAATKTVNNEVGNFDLKITMNGSQVTVNRQCKLKLQQISPSLYPAFRSLSNATESLQGRELIIEVK